MSGPTYPDKLKKGAPIVHENWPQKRTGKKGKEKSGGLLGVEKSAM